MMKCDFPVFSYVSSKQDEPQGISHDADCIVVEKTASISSLAKSGR